MNIVSCALPCFSDPSKLAKFISVVRQMPPHINQRNGRSQFSRPIHMNQKLSGSYHTDSFGFNGGGCGFGGPYDYLACRTITFAFACGASVSSLRANIKAATARLLDQVSRKHYRAQYFRACPTQAIFACLARSGSTDLAARKASVVVCNGGSTAGYLALAEGAPIVGIPSDLTSSSPPLRYVTLAQGCSWMPRRSPRRRYAPPWSA
jgi:hypothetical protein